jgi:hypothetical protein
MAGMAEQVRVATHCVHKGLVGLFITLVLGGKKPPYGLAPPSPANRQLIHR